MIWVKNAHFVLDNHRIPCYNETIGNAENNDKERAFLRKCITKEIVG